MKIIFLCSSLEPGKDGVGDYTRRLATALKKNKYVVTLIAINDKYIKENVLEEEQNDNGELLFVKRLSQQFSWSRKISYLNQQIRDFEPNWLSLQYVPYGFHRKGVPLYFPPLLDKIQGNFRWHIMFHEMWVGISPFSPAMHKIYGFLQRKIASSIVRRLRPTIVHTSNVIYQLIQKQNGINSYILPLFSNIEYKHLDSMAEQHVLDQINLTKAEKKQYTIIGIFGHLYETENIYSTIESELSRSNNKKIILLSFGKIHPNEKTLLVNLTKRYPAIEVYVLGEKQENEISHIMQILDKGLSCTTYELIGKSGAFAAMRRHNLNVLMPKKITVPEFEQEVTQYNSSLIGKPAEQWDVKYVANQFINDLNNYKRLA